MHAQIPEVSLKFRISPVLALILMAASWPFGLAYGVVGTIFGVGLLGLSAALGLPKSIDLMFGLILSLITFGAQFLGAVFVGIEVGGAQVAMVFTTAVVWFVQLAAFGLDVHFFAEAHVRELENVRPKRRGRRSAFSAEVERTAA
ncbi:hypothetical protein OAL71_00550 [Phycisphaerales bacterium]|nr:hypothetical protein [Phycisphaerales bacterium]